MKPRGHNLGDELSRLTARLDRKSGGAYLQATVSRAWAKVAGDSVVGHTTGAHLREGELLVYVDSPVWATELSALSEPYRVALNEEIGEQAVRTVRFSVSRKVQFKVEEDLSEREAAKERESDKVPSVPLSDAEIQESSTSLRPSSFWMGMPRMPNIIHTANITVKAVVDMTRTRVRPEDSAVVPSISSPSIWRNESVLRGLPERLPRPVEYRQESFCHPGSTVNYVT